MSDFSAGIFALSNDVDKIYPFLIKDEVLIQYNDMWVGKLAPTDMKDKYPPQTLALSKEIPLLHIMHAEDHGFFVQVLHEGVVKFNFDIPYNIGHDQFFYEIGEELFGDEWEDWLDGHACFSDESKAENIKLINEKVAQKLKKERIPESFFDNINKENLQVFKLFGCSEETLENIQHILSPEYFEQHFTGMVYSFLDALGLTKFSFVSYDYMNNREYPSPFVVLKRL